VVNLGIDLCNVYRFKWQLPQFLCRAKLVDFITAPNPKYGPEVVLERIRLSEKVLCIQVVNIWDKLISLVKPNSYWKALSLMKTELSFGRRGKPPWGCSCIRCILVNHEHVRILNTGLPNNAATQPMLSAEFFQCLCLLLLIFIHAR